MLELYFLGIYWHLYILTTWDYNKLLEKVFVNKNNKPVVFLCSSNGGNEVLLHILYPSLKILFNEGKKLGYTLRFMASVQYATLAQD